MTRLGFVADVHIGNHKRHGGEMRAGLNERCRMSIEALERAARVAIDEQGCDALIVLGDLFDTANPSPQVVRAVQRVFEPEEPDGQFAVVIKGNHDSVSSLLGDHALGPLSPVAQVVEHSEIIQWDDIDLLCVPFKEGKAITWFPSEVAKLGKDARKDAVKVLAFHLGVEDERTSHFLQGAADSIPLDVLEDLIDDYGIRYAFAGNWHEHQHWYVKDGVHGVMQVGTLIPTGWDNDGVDGYGTLAIFDPKVPTIECIEIPGPRFVTVQGPRADTFLINCAKEGHTMFARYKSDSVGIQDAAATVADWKAEGIIHGGEVKLDDVEQRAAARTAAEHAKSADTLDEAVHNFVKTMPLDTVELPNGQKFTPERGDVLHRTKDLLGGAS